MVVGKHINDSDVCEVDSCVFEGVRFSRWSKCAFGWCCWSAPAVVSPGVCVE